MQKLLFAQRGWYTEANNLHAKFWNIFDRLWFTIHKFVFSYFVYENCTTKYLQTEKKLGIGINVWFSAWIYNSFAWMLSFCFSITNNSIQQCIYPERLNLVFIDSFLYSNHINQIDKNAFQELSQLIIRQLWVKNMIFLY